MVDRAVFLIFLASQITHSSGYQMFNAAIEMCCGGTVSAVTETTNSCCGTTFYDENTQACCDGVVQPFPVEGESHYACCGTVAYSHDQQTCCGAGNLHWGASLECCGARPYDASTMVCCENQQAYNRIEGYECCSHRIYDDMTNCACCSVYDDDGTLSIQITSRFSIKTGAEKTSCCGLEAYNYQEEVCCDDKVLMPKPAELEKDEWGVCCGGEVIVDHATQLCCDNTIVTRDSDEYSCCGIEKYNHMTQTCCGKKILDDDSGDECCWEAGESYNPETQACCGYEVQNLTPDEIGQLYENGECCIDSNL